MVKFRVSSGVVPHAPIVCIFFCYDYFIFRQVNSGFSLHILLAVCLSTTHAFLVMLLIRIYIVIPPVFCIGYVFLHMRMGML